MPESKNDVPEFNLAITMAGAGSAGCYTAGVMDYLFEILDLWEKARQADPEILRGQKEKIPRHRVVIDAMGGTSAGGMTATMSAIYALNGKINPVFKPGEIKETKQNLFYDSWVLMDDDSKFDARPLFEKIWDLEDLEAGRLGSLLNSKFIDTIADKSFAVAGDADKSGAGSAGDGAPGKSRISARTASLPPYISKDLQLLFSHCLLRGIPLEVNFETAIAKTGRKSVLPNHTTFEHYIVSHYHLNKGVAPDLNKYLWLNPYEDAYSATMKLSTKATGAFPLGLLYREFTPDNFSDGYIKTTLKRIILGEFGNPDPDPKNEIELNYFPKNFSSYTVDGGAINNEPYREVLSILKDRYGETPSDGYHRYGVIMIDPFPDRAQSQPPYDKPNDLLDVAKEIISALTDQSRIKRREMLEADASKYFRSILFPRKWILDQEGKPLKPERTAIACSSGMAFGGFLDIRFRQHDFFLGRNNARTFFRYFFSFPYKNDKDRPDEKIVHPIHEHWTDDMINAFKIEKDGQVFLPILPDMNILLEKEKGVPTPQYAYDIPSMPAYDPDNLFAMRSNMKSRFRKILQMLESRDFSKEIEKAKEKELELLSEKQQEKIKEARQEIKKREEEAQSWMDKYYKRSFFSKAGGFLGKPFRALGFDIASNIVAERMTKMAINAILLDLAKKGLLEKQKK